MSSTYIERSFLRRSITRFAFVQQRIAKRRDFYRKGCPLQTKPKTRSFDMKKLIASASSMLALVATAIALTSCSGNCCNPCCDPCPPTCAPRQCCPRPCPRPCPKPCPQVCPPQCAPVCPQQFDGRPY